ncbi:sensor histidine kinase [Natrarchaeobius halalkaliphilus]|uniref:sensor histidine kinase n=1 Tax=Natrarchaeobius halalkaliphilus TaxID=1679091 RepID=UPI001FB44FBC|nr:HAMP domain-containing sensor histidine kinase [Natrarchaeobius halalkaliphilus]
MTRQNERLDEFTSVVSHDLRSPLNVADGRLKLAQEECESEHLEDVAASHERMNALIDDLLTLAREGEQISEPEPVELASLTEQCWNAVETANATLLTESTSQVRADRSRLQQLLENLLRNAIEHGGADVTVSVGTVDTGFYVEDDGPGIPESDRQIVLEFGYSSATEGTGFGLSIVEQVATSHGWDVRVTEGSEGGARIEITDVEFVSQ